MAGMFAVAQQGKTNAAGLQPSPFAINQPKAAKVHETPFGQQLQQQATGLFAAGQNAMAQTHNYDAAPKLLGSQDLLQERQRIESAVRANAERNLGRRYEEEEAAFRQSLANRGLDSGSVRYNKELEAFRRSKDDAYREADFAAMREGGAEMDRAFTQSLQARQQAIGETEALRDRPFKEMAALLNPTLEMYGLETQKGIASMQDETQRYGIDTDATVTREGHATQKSIAELQDLTQRYGYDKAYETAGLDRTSREEIARMQDDTAKLSISSQEKIAQQRNELDRALQEGRITSEEKMAAERNLIDQQLQEERLAAEQALQKESQTWQSGEKTLDRKFTKRQNAKDRQIQREQIRAQMANRGGGGGGGGEAPLDINAIMAMMQLLGEE